MFLILLALALSTSYAEMIDLSLKKVDLMSPEFIFSTSHAYEPEAAQEAYVHLRLIATKIQYEHDPQYKNKPELLNQQYEDTYNSAMDYVRGNVHRIDATKQILNESISVIAGIAKLESMNSLNALIELPESVANAIVNHGLDLLVREGQMPTVQYDTVVSTNTYALKQAQGADFLSQRHRRVAQEFHKDLNFNRALELHPTVVRKHIEIINSRRLKNFERLARRTYGDFIKQQGQRLDQLDSAMNAMLLEGKKPLNEVLELVRLGKERQDRVEAEQRTKEKMEGQRIEVMSNFGILSGIATLLKNHEGAAFIDQAARFTSEVYRAFSQSSSISTNPMTFVNPYVSALNLGVALFAGPSQDPNATVYRLFGETLRQLHELRIQIFELGRHIDRRFDVIDHVLQKAVFDSTREFNQITSTGNYTTQQLERLQDLLAVTHQQSYGTQIFLSGTKWLDTEKDCFSSNGAIQKMTANQFRHCRNMIALLATYGKFDRSDSNEVPPIDIIADLAFHFDNQNIQRFSHSLGMPQPEVWLAATGMLMRLAAEHPKHKALLHDHHYSEELNLSLQRMIDVGIYYQQITRNLALEAGPAGKAKLRRSIINNVITNYRETILETFDYLREVPERVAPGLPDLRSNLYDQAPSDDPKMYSFLVEPVQFCTNEDRIVSRIDGDSVKWSMLSSNMVNEAFKKHSADLQWPSNLTSLLPRLVRHAVASAMSKPDRLDLKISACLSRVQVWDKYLRGVFDSPDSDIALDVTFFATYRNEDDQRKVREVARLEVRQSIATASYLDYNSGNNPLLPAWNGTFPFNPKSSIWARLPGTATILLPKHDEFTDDFSNALSRVKDQVKTRVIKELPLFDARAQRATNELSLIFERGLDNSEEKVGELMQFVSEPMSLPTASTWAKVFLTSNIGLGQLRRSLKQRLDHLTHLIEVVDDLETLKPGKDLFGSRIRDLSALQHEVSSDHFDRPWYRRFF